MAQAKETVLPNLTEMNKAKRTFLCITPDLSRTTNIADSPATPSSNERRRSVARPPGGMSILGLISSKRLAKQLARRATLKQEVPFVKLDNTYRMEPYKKFLVPEVREIIKEVLEGQLANEQYNKDTTPKLTEDISEDIKHKVKQLSFDRYKIIVSVVIGEKASQGVTITSRCSWDANLDNFSTFTFTSSCLFCTASVYGLYFE
ncbi:hypothetical protein SNE40_004837 [Patella caerulea]|uniref:Uncharacterized protein n=1 Tax=Patella caerulea TaxID=87958 RepID=A0AAN8Q1E8_PATCE